MQTMWVSTMENVNCRSKLTDVVGRTKKCSKKRGFSSGKENLDVEVRGKGNSEGKGLFRLKNPRKNEIDHQLEQTGNINTVCEVVFRPNFPRTQFIKISNEDPSRNIVDIIFRKSLTDPAKPSRKIKRVFKVKNSLEILERFERYREMVKKKAYEQSKSHPRCSVDGNELLKFYGTVMTCGERSTQVSELCKDPFCRVCRIIQSNFDTEHYKKNGIWFGTSSEELCDNMFALTKVKNIKRAVIVCRTIAGRVANNMVDGVYEECHSFTTSGGDLTVKNPCAVLPCFVVVFT